MPVYKYKTFEDAERALWSFFPDESYLKNVSELWDFANKLSPLNCPRGIFKYRTLEEANKEREKLEIIQAKEIQAKRHTIHK